MSKNIIFHPVFTNYGCDKSGNVYSNYRNKIRKLKPYVIDRYYRFEAGSNNNISVHKFVMECKLQKVLDLSDYSNEGMTIDHINNDRIDNRWENLQLLTRIENVKKYHRDVGHQLWEVPSHNICDILPSDHESIEKVRGLNRKYQNIYRAKNRRDSKVYQKEYMKEYFSDPIKRKIHMERVFIRKVMEYKSKKRTAHRELAKILKPWLERIKENQSVQHIIPLSHMLAYDIHMEREILHDLDNMRIIDGRVCGYDYISNEALEVAESLERKHLGLSGFTKWLTERQTKFLRPGKEVA